MRRVSRTGAELAVRERAGAAQAELDVARRVELACPVESLDGGGAARGVVPLLDEQRLETGFGQGERCEEPRAAGTGHHGAVRGPRAAGEGIREDGGVGGDGPHAPPIPLADAGEQALLVGGVMQLDADGEREVHVLLPAGVDRLPVKLHAGDVPARAVEQLHGCAHTGLAASVLGRAVPQAAADLGDLKHGRPPFRRGPPRATPRRGCTRRNRHPCRAPRRRRTGRRRGRP